MNEVSSRQPDVDRLIKADKQRTASTSEPASYIPVLRNTSGRHTPVKLTPRYIVYTSLTSTIFLMFCLNHQYGNTVISIESVYTKKKSLEIACMRSIGEKRRFNETHHPTIKKKRKNTVIILEYIQLLLKKNMKI